MNKYESYTYAPAFSYESGWDKFALTYASLLRKDTLYYLHKEMMYYIMEQQGLVQGGAMTILDLNCGTGNDFPYLTSYAATLYGCDGSAGMLNKAAETYRALIEGNKLKLYKGMIEDLDTDSLGNARFDLIFSITGGFSYVDDDTFKQVFRKLTGMLKPGGKIVTAHLNIFCLPETLFFLSKGKFKDAFRRRKNGIKISIKEETMTMYLRGESRLRELMKGIMHLDSIAPLLACTPPYQTGYNPSVKMLSIHKKIECFMADKGLGKGIADQVVMITSNQ